MNIDWISWDWRTHKAKAPIYVFLWAGGLCFYWLILLSLSPLSLSLCYEVQAALFFFKSIKPWANISFSFSLITFLLTQRVQPFDKRYQYLLFAAEPYEIIAFKVNNCIFFLSFLVPFSPLFQICYWALSPFVLSCGNLLLCWLICIFRSLAQRLISPLQSFSRTGTQIQRCSRLVYLINPVPFVWWKSWSIQVHVFFGGLGISWYLLLKSENKKLLSKGKQMCSGSIELMRAFHFFKKMK